MIILEYEGKNEQGQPVYVEVTERPDGGLTDRPAAMRWLRRTERRGVYHIYPDRKRVLVGEKEVTKKVFAVEEID